MTVLTFIKITFIEHSRAAQMTSGHAGRGEAPNVTRGSKSDNNQLLGDELCPAPPIRMLKPELPVPKNGSVFASRTRKGVVKQTGR